MKRIVKYTSAESRYPHVRERFTVSRREVSNEETEGKIAMRKCKTISANSIQCIWGRDESGRCASRDRFSRIWILPTNWFTATAMTSSWRAKMSGFEQPIGMIGSPHSLDFNEFG